MRAFAPVEAGLTETWMASAAPCLPLSKCFEVMVTFVNLHEQTGSQWIWQLAELIIGVDQNLPFHRLKALGRKLDSAKHLP